MSNLGKSFWLVLFFTGCFHLVLAQQAVITGTVTDDSGKPVQGAEITWLEGNKKTQTDSKGNYYISAEPGKATFLLHAPDKQDERIEFTLQKGESRIHNVAMKPPVNVLKTVVIESTGNKDNREVSTFKIDPKIPKYLPSAFGDFNKILATVGMGIVSNSELSSTYAVRGGNFDENLVYVNDMEVYRPFLVRAGQQEGLSFVNPDLVSDIEFSAGGWQPKYGDKLSSVLAIKYKDPKRLKGSATLGLLGGAVHVEGATKNRRVSVLIGARNKSAKYLLNTLPVKGQYKPQFYDVQSLITFDLTKRKDSMDFKKRTTLSLFTTYAFNRYNIVPTKSQTTFGTLDQAMRLNVLYEGKEVMDYNTFQNSIKLTHKPDKRLELNLILAAMHSAEREYFDVEAAYKLCDIDTDPNSQNFNECIFTRGYGTTFRHARNKLEATVVTLSHKGGFDWNEKNSIQWGISQSNEIITDQISEYSFQDSSFYVTLTDNLKSTADLNSYRTQAYIQHTFKPDSVHIFTYGVRVNYWSLNRQLLVSPRLQYALKPKWKRDFIFKIAAGVYQQPAFYREMRDFRGNINRNIKAQTSYHFIAGTDYKFKIGSRGFTFITEVYYKHLTNVIPYDLDNVRLRYYALNNATAYAAGADMRISGEFIKGEESWFSLSYLTTKEDVDGDGKGYIRRPTDQRLTAGIFFQDHIPNNPSIKMYLNLVYGSGLPFGPPNATAFRSYFKGPSYKRVDIGFSKLISFTDKERLKGKTLESLWISLEVLNLLGVANTISYGWIADYNSNQYAVPNTLSARFVNLRMIARF